MFGAGEKLAGLDMEHYGIQGCAIIDAFNETYLGECGRPFKAPTRISRIRRENLEQGDLCSPAPLIRVSIGLQPLLPTSSWHIELWFS
jgi:hypothetical protein